MGYKGKESINLVNKKNTVNKGFHIISHDQDTQITDIVTNFFL